MSKYELRWNQQEGPCRSIRSLGVVEASESSVFVRDGLRFELRCLAQRVGLHEGLGLSRTIVAN